MSKQRQVARKLREMQGQALPIEIDGRQYVYKKLKRKRCHQVLYGLVAPFIEIVSAIISEVTIPLDKILSGNFDPQKWANDTFKELTINLQTVAKLVRQLPFKEYWALAQSILDDVEIDGVQMGLLDEHEFYDDKPFHMAKAILKGIEVNYPFLPVMTKTKGDGSNDSSQENRSPKIE